MDIKEFEGLEDTLKTYVEKASLGALKIISLFKPEIDRCSGGTVLTCCELSRIAVCEDAVTLFDKRKPVFSEFSACIDILLLDIHRFLIEDLYHIFKRSSFIKGCLADSVHPVKCP